MITRRNIRVKVMQVLYQLETEQAAGVNPVKILESRLEQTPRLFTYLIFFLTEIARYAEKDASMRSSKHLATTEDRNVNIKLAGNNIVWAILENPSYVQAMSEYKFNFDGTQDLVRKTYDALVTGEKYKEYIQQQSREVKNERELLSFIFSDLMLPNENFVSHIEENFFNWDDDAETFVALI